MEPTNETVTGKQMIAGFPADFPFAGTLANAGILDPQGVLDASDEQLRAIPGFGPARVSTVRGAASQVLLALKADPPPDAPTDVFAGSPALDVEQVGTGPIPASLLTPVLPLLARNHETGKLAEHLVITVSADDFVQVATRRKADQYVEVMAVGDTLEEALAEAVPQLKKLKGWA